MSIENNDYKKIQDEATIGLKLCEEGKLDEGIKHLQYAAEHNDITSIVNLGHALKLNGQLEEAFKWTLRGASLGHKTAISNLSIMYRAGQGTPCNVEESVKCGKKLIELGDLDNGYSEIVSAYRYAKDESQRNMNKAFEYALEGSTKIIEQNPSPEKGSKCETVIQLALCYNFGKGIKKDIKEAIKYYEYCCNCGSNFAMYNLGCIYVYSEDENIKDEEKGIKLFHMSGEAGYADAYFELGNLYHKEEKKDLDLAEIYYAKAIRLGNGDRFYEEAVKNLRTISEEDAELVLSGKYCPLID